MYSAQEFHELVTDLGRGFVLYPVPHISQLLKESPTETVCFFLRRNQVVPDCASVRILPIKTIVRAARPIASVKATQIRNHDCILNPRKGCLIRFKQSNLIPNFVFASSAQIQGEHLVFLHADGSLAALFLLEVVESWSEIEF